MKMYPRPTARHINSDFVFAKNKRSLEFIIKKKQQTEEKPVAYANSNFGFLKYAVAMISSQSDLKFQPQFI